MRCGCWLLRAAEEAEPLGKAGQGEPNCSRSDPAIFSKSPTSLFATLAPIGPPVGDLSVNPAQGRPGNLCKRLARLGYARAARISGPGPCVQDEEQLAHGRDECHFPVFASPAQAGVEVMDDRDGDGYSNLRSCIVVVRHRYCGCRRW